MSKSAMKHMASLIPKVTMLSSIWQGFMGNSHMAGKYSKEGKRPGYWDKIIGPGKIFDTDWYFIIGMDVLSNITPNHQKVVATGPASINPATGKPYGMSFPMITLRDIVNAQYEVLESLGVK